jgi:hypothetical protein
LLERFYDPEGEDEDCVCSEPKKVQISLKCPYTFQAIKVPARGKECQHLQVLFILLN